MRCLFTAAIMALTPCLTIAVEPTPQQLEFFESNIRPILVQHCYECHNSGGTAEGGLSMDHRAALLKGGESGPLLVVGKPQESLLIKILRHEVEGQEMPQGGSKLSANIIANFERWIRDGAVDPRDHPPRPEELAAATSWDAVMDRRKQWWSLQPITDPAIPTGGNWSAAAHPVDQFLRQKMHEHGLEPAAEADRATLIRRLSQVLLGLPPSPEEIAAFVPDDTPDAYERLVDRMLASPHFGERWARHWMDWFRYAETHGSEGDPAIPFAWQYRDYLIRAINADVPYDQLIREHVAGDLLTEPRINHVLGLNESLIGIAQYRFVQHGFAPTDALDEKVRFTDNQIDVLTKALLGLTVSCARCHNHKFDAISQTDYYALFGILGSCRPATITIDSPERQQLHRQELVELKQSIRRELAAVWASEIPDVIAGLRTGDGRWGTLIDEAKAPTHPLHAWRELRGLSGDEFASKWQELSEVMEQSQQRLSDRQRRWVLGKTDDASAWTRHGSGMLDDQPAAGGEFLIRPDGEVAIDGILPSGAYSGLLSTRHSGHFSSPRFKFDMHEVYVRTLGDGEARSRYVVQNYPRRGTVYPVANLNGGKLAWQKWNLDYWQGDEGHLEFSTAADQAVELSTGTERSWFGVTEVVFVNDGQQPPADEPAEFNHWLLELDAPQSADELLAGYTTALTAAVAAFGEQQMTDQQVLFLRHFVRNSLLPVTLAELDSVRPLIEQYRQLEAQIRVPTRAPGIVEGDPFDQPLFVRGDHRQPSEAVPRRFLEAFDAAPYATNSSGRLSLAQSLLDPQNPLLSRVLVNRLWHHVFGRGIVATPDNFGSMGREPTHPELLDWLATQFQSAGPQQYSFKQMLRLLVTSHAFRQSVTASELALRADPDNQWLSHWPVRRLEAEAIRDSLLVTTGQLDRTLHGPPVGDNSPRRSIYLNIRRNNMPELLTTFDAPVPFSTVGRRDVTNVPAQSLSLLNDPFLIELAGRWVRQTQETGDVAERVAQMFSVAFGRRPTEHEHAALQSYLTSTERSREAVRNEMQRIEGELHEVRESFDGLQQPVRERILTARMLDSAAPMSIDLKPIARWDFDDDARDAVGELHGTLQGNARIEDGALVLDGSSQMVTQPLTKLLQAKTLEAWVQLDDLNQRAGGVMTVQTADGVTFDSIVFAEQAPAQWLSGSNNFRRTKPFQGTNETEASENPVHIAITYAADGTITAYRNGQPYGQPYQSDGPKKFAAGGSVVLFGLRHSPPTGNRFLKGRITQARLYDRALTSDEVAASASGDPRYISPSQLAAAMTPDELAERERLQRQALSLQAQLAGYSEADRSDDPNRAWQDLAMALINFKEFLYIR
ncbi:MAG: DUF1553 domain-containing protein [Planctomycetaceae bacterium]|nr:DUF1553 domain-containing protein [Planctomycetaceae bacterium]